MRNPEDQLLAEAVDEAQKLVFEEDRCAERAAAMESIGRLHEENRRGYNRRRREARKYQLNDLVAIKNTQFVAGGKLRADFMGPYRVIFIADNDRYGVERVRAGPGPARTSTAADLMKPWAVLEDDGRADPIPNKETDEEDGFEGFTCFASRRRRSRSRLVVKRRLDGLDLVNRPAPVGWNYSG